METIISEEKLDEILDRCGRGKEAVIPILQAIQAEIGYVPRPAMEYVVKNSSIEAVEIYGVATFYTQFRLKPIGRNVIKVCHGTACHVAGAVEITNAIRDELNLKGEEDTTEDKMFTVEDVACLGCCSLAPVIMVGDISHGKLTPKSVRNIIKDYQKKGRV